MQKTTTWKKEWKAKINTKKVRKYKETTYLFNVFFTCTIPPHKPDKSLIKNQVISEASVSFHLSVTQRTTSAQSHQGRQLWLTLSSRSVINHFLRPNFLPVLWLLPSTLSPQDGDELKQEKPPQSLLDSFHPSRQSMWHHQQRDRGCAKDKCLEMYYIIFH